ncbi:cbb3-type cytochrome oxidase maturation protein [Amaricoccus macauensis]|jgi:cbb3-type cytochrome oxidase maturation protein|uniref:Cbb3-type cytochrome oxidase maturation protein n=1 Tax=Amaricoccus macauensis TaxID=57001 RepID=A0A840SMM6_9RHOB|nr:cbb3-type cytochrome oxidase maturation protein [Amaricoccus macauensis]
MNVLVYLIPIALVLGGLGLVGFLWTLRTGHYEDLQGQATRILSDRYDDHPADDRPENTRAETGESRLTPPHAPPTTPA